MADIGTLELDATIDTSDYDSKTKSIENSNKKLRDSTDDAVKSQVKASKSTSMFSKVLGGLRKVAKAAAGATIAGVGALGTATVVIGKQAVAAYSDYQQAVGGVDTLFKDSSATVQKYAAEAYKTAGVSANSYMNQVTSFAASLVSSLGGDTKAAAELGNTAILDMSDNANKMGTSVASIQGTYQSLARGNYAMLDNLKLGYGGTKAEMQRMISDANKLEKQAGRAGDLSISKFSDVVTAIHDVQDNLGITGTTAKEASDTISGSINQMQASWQNWLTALGDPNADLAMMTGQLVDSFSNVVKNIMPIIGQVLKGIAKMLPAMIETAISILPGILSQLADSITQTVGTLLAKVFHVDPSVFDSVIGGLKDTFTNAFQAISSAVTTAWNIISPILGGIVKSIPGIVQGLLALVSGAKPIGMILGAVFTGFLEALNIVMGVLGRFGTFLSKHKTTATVFATAIGGITAAWIALNAVSKAQGFISSIQKIGGVLPYMAKLLNLTKLQSAAMLVWSGITKAGAVIQAAFNAVMAINPFVLIIAAIAAVVAALVWFFTQTEVGRKAWSSFTSWLGGVWKGLQTVATTVFTAIGSFFTNIFHGIGNVITSVWNAVRTVTVNVWNAISGFISTALTNIRNIVVNVVTVIGAIPVWLGEQLRKGVDAIFSWITNTLTGWSNNTTGFVHGALQGMIAFVQIVWQTLHTIVSIGINLIRTIVVVVVKLLQGDWSGAWDAIKGFFSSTWLSMQTLLQNVLSILHGLLDDTLNKIRTLWTNVWNAISGFFQGVWNGIVGFFTPIIHAIQSTITSVVNAIRNVWDSVWGSISGFFSKVWKAMVLVYTPIINAIRTTISNVINAIASVWRSVWGGISGFFKGIWNGMKNAVSSAMKGIGNIIRGIKDTVMGPLKSAGSWLGDVGHNIISGLIGGVKGAFGWLKKTITDMGKNVLKWAKNVLHIGSPSKVFADQVGKFIPEGVAVGVDANTDSAVKSIQGLAGSMVDAINPVTVSQQAVGSTVLPSADLSTSTIPAHPTSIIIKNMTVRNDNDIRLVAQELYRLQQRDARSV